MGGIILYAASSALLGFYLAINFKTKTPTVMGFMAL